MNITEARSPNKELDAIEEKLRKEINKAYKQALKEMTDKFNDATKEFAKLDKKKRQEVKDGKLSDREYKAWRKEQLMTKKWMMDMIAEISNKCTEATQKSAEIINDHLPQAYASGHNRGAYEIETGINASTSMSLIPTRAVRNAVDEGKVLYPKSRVKIPKDRAWNAKHLKAEIAQGIIQGESIDEIAKRLGRVAAMSASTAMRMARTMTGCAMNMGHFDSAKEAQDLGIEVEKVWIATPDLRTRDSHRHMDLERVPLDDKFSNGLMFPKDPEGAPAEVYNCRCRIVNLPEGIDLDLTDRFERLPEGMTYDQWKQGKQKQATEVEVVTSEFMKMLHMNAKDFGVEYNKVYNLDKKLTEEDIIQRLGGGDETKGSCASVAFAYIGNKAGLDVLDFRGGYSRSLIGKSGTIKDVCELEGVNGKIAKGHSDYTATKELFNQMEYDKEYLFSSGMHVAIIKKTKGVGYEYLELQSQSRNGYHKIDRSTLSLRFGLKKSHSVRGQKVEVPSYLIDIEKLYNNQDFKDMLGYINTPKDKQMKGDSGGIK